MNFKSLLEGAKMIRNYRTSRSQKNKELTRLWLETTVLKAGGFEPGMALVITPQEGYVHIRVAQVYEKQTHKVHHRKGEPLLDVSNKDIDSVLGAGIKIDVLVREQEIYVYKEMSFNVFDGIPESNIKTSEPHKFKVVSLFCGGGGMTSGFINTGACDSVFAVDSDTLENNPADYEEKGKVPGYRAWTIETFRENFPNTLIYWGDIRSVHPIYVPKASIVLVSPPCVEYSGLGSKLKGIVEHFSFHIVRLILATGAFAVFFENVPSFFKSKTFQKIKEMLSPVYPEWHYKTIDSYELGSIQTRKRGYSVCFRDSTIFEWPEIPNIPKAKRKKVKDFIEKAPEEEWFSIEGSAIGTLLTSHKNKFAHTGFTADKNNLLVELESDKVSCFVKGYMKRQSVCSYFKHPTQKGKWRLFRPTEIIRMMNYPKWFRFPNRMPNTKKYEVAGNSVDVRPIEAIASNIVSALMEYKIRLTTREI